MTDDQSLTQTAIRLRAYRKDHPDWNREKNLRWREENRAKYLAHKAVEDAVRRSGKLVRQPCERCGTTERVIAHHDDYSKQLDVMWLCPEHHRERHRELPPEPRKKRVVRHPHGPYGSSANHTEPSLQGENI